MAELITMALFCGALIVCIIAGISIIPALLAGVVIFLAHGRLTGHTFTAMISKGFATMRAASIVVVTFVLIGLLTTLWRAAGTVSFIVTNTAGLGHPHVVVLLTFLLNCLMSLLTGSSFASAATMGVITMTLGTSMQVPPVFLGQNADAHEHFRQYPTDAENRRGTVRADVRSVCGIDAVHASFQQLH